MNYIWNSNLSKNLRARFVSLLLNVYIDSQPRTKKIVPMLVKQYQLKNNDENQNFNSAASRIYENTEIKSKEKSSFSGINKNE